MKSGVIFLALTIFGVSGQTWVSRARLKDFNVYFREAMKEMFHELERREWCNLKIQDQTVVVDEHMYRWHLSGNVTFANGFLISMQRIHLSNIESLFTSQTVNGTVQATGTVRGLLSLTDVKVGFDVIFDVADGSEQHYTGVYAYRLISFRPMISKNFYTGNITASVEIVSLAAGTTRMEFMPANNVTEVISRRAYVASSIFNSVRDWGRSVMQSILQPLVTTKLEFPSICFVNC